MSLRLFALPLATRRCVVLHLQTPSSRLNFSTSAPCAIADPRLKDIGSVIQNDFAALREKYDVPKHPIILAHGLLGFDEMHLLGNNVPGIQYWRGIREALSKAGIEVITATVPPSGSLERRAQRLAETIEEKANGKSVNIIA